MPQVLLVAGHASGAVRVWELKSQLGGEGAAGSWCPGAGQELVTRQSDAFGYAFTMLCA